MNHSKIIVICGPSGSGKGSVIRSLIVDAKLNLYWAKTATTRPRRADDPQTSRRIFMDRKRFEKLWEEGKIIERNEFDGHHYGTPISEIESHQDKNTILETDINGALALKKYYGNNCLSIFLHSSIKDLKRRLRLRGMPDKVIDTRLKIARGELERERQCDEVVANAEGRIPETIENLTMIVKGFLEDK